MEYRFSFLDYVYQVARIAVEIPTNFDEAFERFYNDVCTGFATDETAPYLDDFDFAKAKKKWDNLDEIGKQDAVDEWRLVCTREFEIAAVKTYRGSI